MLAVTICATEKYSYALRVQAQAVQNAVLEARGRGLVDQVSVILATNKESIGIQIGALYERLLPGVDFRSIVLDIDDTSKSHKVLAQKNIARLRSEAFNMAKALNCPFVWSLDSDVLPKHNSLATSFDVIKFDDGYYQVASCPYPSQGGGSFLCGRGTFRENILRDVYDEEKKVNPKILKRVKKYEAEVEAVQAKLRNAKQSVANDALWKKGALLNHKIHLWRRYIRNRAMADDANIFRLNGKTWRKRGWFDFAYPAIGKGSIVPTDWTGFGCVLMTQKALNMIDFHGYEGRGTEDLFITWQRWFLNGIKIGAIPHCPADHVVRSRQEKDKKIHIFTFHEPDGEFEGHLRQDYREFNEFV
jgi:hypothetical protein